MKQGAQTLGNGLALMSLLVAAEQPLRLSEAARELGLHKNTVYRLLNELEGQGFVGRDENKRYLVGPSLISLAAKTIRSVDLRGAARLALERIGSATEETVALYIRQGQYRVCVDAVQGTHLISRMAQIGEIVPLHAGQSGKCILAHLDPAEIETILSTAADQGFDIEQIRQQLEEIRRLGYRLSIGERTPNVAGLAAPVFGMSGWPIAAVAVSGPSERWDMAAMERAAPLVLSECEQLSTMMGASAKTSHSDPDIAAG